MVTLIQLKETESILLVNLHHIVSDGWSIGVLIEEIKQFYSAFVSNKSSFLPQLSIQYADFSAWQRNWLQGEVLTKQLNYWRKQLDEISVLNLPTDKPRPTVQTYEGGRKYLQLSQPLSEALEALSQQEGVTLFITLLTAFKILIYRYTQQEDIAIGSPIANRNRSEIEGLIGFFVNSLVLRTQVSGTLTFRELLHRVKDISLAAYAHQDLPFEKLVEELHPERNLNQNPLFQVVFAIQNAPMQPLELPGLTLKPQQLDIGTTRFDLEFHLWERTQGNNLWVDSSQGIGGLIIYSKDLFNESTINRMLGHFQTLLESIVKHPEQRISELSILTPAEQHQLMVEWNQTSVDYPKKLLVHQLFEQQVKNNPNQIALVFSNQQITYSELNRRSNQLAHTLQKLGVAEETLVGICIEPSLELIVGILGILKARGAYVPVDPNYPSERLSFILKDTQVSILLTQQKVIQRLGKLDPQVICLDADWENIAQENPENSENSATINNRAYVIYTSGSTGTPKGVEIEHRGLLNLMYWHQNTFHFLPQDKITQLFGVAFDACVWEIWTTLTSGASLYFPPPDIRLSPEKLRDWLIQKEITISFIPTILTEKLLVLNWSKNTKLRIVFTGGDKLTQSPSASIPFQVINNYGPTENTVVTTSGQVPISSENPEQPLIPSIGRPIFNTEIYGLDPYLQPVPINIPGELYISGDGLARGYLNQPNLTAEKFIEIELLNTPKRLYKTGDLVRYREDGSLEFMSRLDDQVKIRGFRIELGEIETILSQHPAVLQTVVTTHKNQQGENHLVAYLTLKADYSLKLDTLETDQILQWQMLYNETYNQSVVNLDPTFNIIGWNSSYTHQPIPAEQMANWVNHQASQILGLQPKRVLEIGCGTGLLLFKIAPHCTEYLGTDFSKASIHYIQQQLSQNPLPQVKLLEEVATDFNGIETEKYDTVILNSVVQYFPSLEYLMNVLEKAIASTTSDSFIFIGDIRSLPLLTAFHASVQLEQAEPSVTREQLQQRVKMQMFEETELVIDPAFFTGLKQHFPRINQVEIQLLRGQDQNELTQFRYNVILKIGNRIKLNSEAEPEWLNWSENQLTLEKIRQKLKENQPQQLSILEVPNARVTKAIKITEWLSGQLEYKWVGQIRDVLENLTNNGIDPEAFWSLGEELGYKTKITWSNSNLEGRYDVIFFQSKLNHQNNSSLSRPLRSYSNNPLQAKAARQFIPKLQTYLSEKLPDYMIPSAFMVLELFPLNSNGKIDRQALPKPDNIQTNLVNRYVPPQTAIEEALVKIFAEVLGIKRMGIQDNFFELGGHSLLATQLVSRVRDILGVELPLRCVFEAPTIAPLAQIIEGYKNSQGDRKAPALVAISRESRRIKLSSIDKS